MELIGGHYFDAGNRGPRPLTSVASTGLLDEPQMVAYQTYLAHAKTCRECPQSTFQCNEAARLYEAYRQASGRTPRTQLGVCHCCGEAVHEGDERREVIESGTSASPEVLLHRGQCRPPAVRRHP